MKYICRVKGEEKRNMAISYEMAIKYILIMASSRKKMSAWLCNYFFVLCVGVNAGMRSIWQKYSYASMIWYQWRHARRLRHHQLSLAGLPCLHSSTVNTSDSCWSIISQK